MREPDYNLKPTSRLHAGSDTDYQVDEHGCITIWNCDSETPIRIAPYELHALYVNVFNLK